MSRTLIPAFLVMTACAPGEPPDDPGTVAGVELLVSATDVAAGGEVVLTLANRTDREVGYNLCPAVLERREAGTWREREERPAEVCTMELRLLMPGGTADYTHRIQPGLPGGEYRFRVGIELGDAFVSVASSVFRVR